MGQLEDLKTRFRDGDQRGALQACEELCRSQPDDLEYKRLCALMHGLTGNFASSSAYLRSILAVSGDDADALFNLGVSEREQRNFAEAGQCYLLYTKKFPNHWEGWANLAECRFQSNDFDESLRAAGAAIRLNPAAIQAWITQGDSQRALKRYEDALKSYKKANSIQAGPIAWHKQGLVLIESGRHPEAIERFSAAIRLAPDFLPALASRGEAFQYLGRIEEALADYQKALSIKPDEAAALKNACVCLLRLRRGGEALELCRNALRRQPGMLTARLGISWVLSEIVPTWHVPMMNDHDRNTAYYAGLKAAVTADRQVFEIGAGSGLLSMMAARLGAKSVVACEAVPLIAETAQRIVERNHCQDVVKILAKTSLEVEVGKDLPEKADLLVHEIFSSELIGEHVLPAIEDAKRRLIKPDAKIIPATASVMIALVGGDDVARYVHVDGAFGFDLQDFNVNSTKKLPLYGEDLQLTLMSEDVEAFHFDFVNDSVFPSQNKTLAITATESGRCYGVLQWIRFAIDETTRFDNHPARKQAVSGWQRIVFRFDEPVILQRGSVVSIFAGHDRSTVWFDILPAA